MSLPLHFTCSGSYVFRSRIEEKQLLRVKIIVESENHQNRGDLNKNSNYRIFRIIEVRIGKVLM